MTGIFVNHERYKICDGIHLPENFDPNDFNYSDGEDFEKELHNLIHFSLDKSLYSNELTKKIINWKTFCHLSPVRANLLRPLSQILNGKVLELGSGCGILTRYLGELGCEVLALEGSLQRAKVTKARTADLKNVSVVCDRIESFQIKEKFDIVTMIGVLQYSRMFSHLDQNAEANLLRTAIENLNQDGILIIAIQNKLGLKYFGGCPEANTDTPYFGLENRYHAKSVIRFDQREIQLLLNSVGLKNQKFLYPFPDYHMPKSIFSARGLKELSSHFICDIIMPSLYQDRMRPDWVTPHFMLEGVWETICNAGLAPHLSNAFLILASRTNKIMDTLDKDNTVVWHYSSDRPAEYATEKKFQLTDDNHIIIKASKICNIETTTPLIKHHLHDQHYINGRIYWYYFVNIVKNPDWKMYDIAQWALLWMQFICKEAKIPDLYELNLNHQTVDGRFYDCTPFNCIMDEKGNLNYIDVEWDFKFKAKVVVIFIRGLLSSFRNITKIASSQWPEIETIGLITSLFNELKIQLDEPLIREAIDFDTFCQKLIHDSYSTNTTIKYNQEVIDALFQSFRSTNRIAFPHKLNDMTLSFYPAKDFEQLVKETQLFKNQIHDLQNEAKQMQAQALLSHSEIQNLNSKLKQYQNLANSLQNAYTELLNTRSLRFMRFIRKVIRLKNLIS